MKKFVCMAMLFCLLAGLCACGRKYEPEETTPATEPVTTTEAESWPIRHTVKKRIGEGMPEFTFTLLGNPGEDADGLNSIRAIVFEDGGQRLEGFETVGPFTPENDYGLAFADFDNDGALDIRLRKWEGGSMRNEPSLFWLWDEGSRSFVRNEQLELLSDEAGVSVGGDGRVSCYTRVMYGEYGTSYYSFADGEFVEEERVEVHREAADGVTYSITETYRLVDGEMKLVSTDREKVEAE
jgi:hypothetical protein